MAIGPKEKESDMAIYGYKTYKAHYWVAEVRTPNGSSYCLTMIADANREQAFRRMSGMRWDKADRIEWLREVDSKNTSDMERYGFIETYPAPALFKPW